MKLEQEKEAKLLGAVVSPGWTVAEALEAI
ncbi:hypothetical protein C770_GR4pC1035 (plasmid) [Sinorhizobium meliloti GR4]|nr:hypothetical protein C770_GR4pC1035 [Sinorhizobium meliloti GR4]